MPSFKLSRYACYLIVQNADPGKEVVALGQTYFAVKTRLQEIHQMDEYNRLRPDLIIHRRDSNEENTLVAEFKGWWNNDIDAGLSRIYKLLYLNKSNNYQIDDENSKNRVN